MSKTNNMETEMLELYFNNTTHAGIGDATGIVGSTADGSLYISLHTSDPGETGNQGSNEISYTGYAREAVARTSGGWTIADDNCSNTAAITFGQCTAGSGTATHFGVGVDATGAGDLLYYGALDSSLAISAGITPEFAIGDLDITEA